MWLTRQAIDRPFLTVLLTVAIALVGLLGWRTLPVDLNPRADLPLVVIVIVYPGAGPGTVETLVARPVEDALKSVPQLATVFTVCQDSVCYLMAEFDLGTDTDAAKEGCREALTAIRDKLPEGIEEPVYERLDINAQPVVFLGLVGSRSPEELRALAADVLEPRLRSVDGVTAVEVLGGREREVAVAVDRHRLQTAGATMSGVLDALRAGSQNMPAGALERGDQQRQVRLLGGFESLDAIRDTPLPPNPAQAAAAMQAALAARRPPPAHAPQRVTRLGDVAEVKLVAADPEVRIRLQQQPGVGLLVTKRGDGNTVEISEAVQRVARTAPLPPDVEVVVARDTASTVREALADVNASMALGILLCAGTIFIFLRDFRATLIVALTLPVCLLGVFAPMAWRHNTLNQMTLLGLALSIGNLVDDSIVCIEAIIHRLRQGEPAAEAAFNGRNDIALADTSTTMLDIAVYGPIAVMAGVVGQFFRDFGFVVATCAALSLLTAYTLVPSLAAQFYRHRPPLVEDTRGERFYQCLEARYHRVLVWALDHRALTLVSGWGGLAVATGLAWAALGVDFIPAADLSTVVVNVEMPAGTSPDATEATVARTEALIAQVPEVETQFSTLGRIEAGFGVVDRMGPGYAQINLTLSDWRGMLDRLLLRGWDLRRRSDSAVADDIRERLRAIPGATLHVMPIKGWGGAGAPIDFSVYGQDLDRMAEAGELILEELRAVPGLLNPDISWRLGAPEVQVRYDRERAGDLLVYPGAIARELRLAVAGDEAGTFNLGDQVLPIRLRLRDADRRDPADLASLPVGQSAERAILLSEVATLVNGSGPTRIDRRNGLRDLNFKGYLAEGVSLGEVQARIEQLMAEVGVPAEGTRADAPARFPSLSWGWRGDAETLAKSTRHMIATGLVGLVLAYLVMAILFNSAVHPFTIMLSVPMALTGALLLLVATGSSLSIVSGIGFILLIGIVVRNAILLIDYTLQLRAQGLSRREAVETSGDRRLRPILMTTVTTIFGMLPVALKIGKGAEIRAPMAIAVIGGLLLSTLLTLVIIPVTYTLFDDWIERLRK